MLRSWLSSTCTVCWAISSAPSPSPTPHFSGLLSIYIWLCWSHTGNRHLWTSITFLAVEDLPGQCTRQANVPNSSLLWYHSTAARAASEHFNWQWFSRWLPAPSILYTPLPFSFIENLLPSTQGWTALCLKDAVHNGMGSTDTGCEDPVPRLRVRYRSLQFNPVYPWFTINMSTLTLDQLLDSRSHWWLPRFSNKHFHAFFYCVYRSAHKHLQYYLIIFLHNPH